MRPREAGYRWVGGRGAFFRSDVGAGTDDRPNEGSGCGAASPPTWRRRRRCGLARPGIAGSVAAGLSSDRTSELVLMIGQTKGLVVAQLRLQRGADVGDAASRGRVSLGRWPRGFLQIGRRSWY